MDLSATTTSQTNFGWPYFEGSRPGTGTPPEDAEFEEAVLEIEHGPRNCGVVGGFIYDGPSVPSLHDHYLYGDLCGSEINALEVDGQVTGDNVVVASLPEGLISFGQAHSGEVYGLGASGGLYRFDPADWKVEPNRQGSSIKAAPIPTVPRTREDCDGIVGVVEPLADMDGYSPQRLESAFGEALAELELLVPALPPSISQDGITVLHSFEALARALAVEDWDSASTRLEGTREDLLAGRGDFTGFPESMARIVDSECG